MVAGVTTEVRAEAEAGAVPAEAGVEAGTGARTAEERAPAPGGEDAAAVAVEVAAAAQGHARIDEALRGTGKAGMITAMQARAARATREAKTTPMRTGGGRRGASPGEAASRGIKVNAALQPHHMHHLLGSLAPQAGDPEVVTARARNRLGGRGDLMRTPGRRLRQRDH